MIRSKSRNKFLKSRSEEDRKAYNNTITEICGLSCLKNKKLLFKFQYQKRCR